MRQRVQYERREPPRCCCPYPWRRFTPAAVLRRKTVARKQDASHDLQQLPQEKQATKLQQDAKAKIRKALKEVAGCKMTVSALKETKWGKTVKKLSIPFFCN